MNDGPLDYTEIIRILATLVQICDTLGARMDTLSERMDVLSQRMRQMETLILEEVDEPDETVN